MSGIGRIYWEITSEKRSNNIKKIYDEPLLEDRTCDRSCDDLCEAYALEKKIISET